MRKVYLVILILVVFGAVIGSYHESLVIMRGDYLLTRWMGITETNKNWQMVFFLAICGGSLVWMALRLVRKLKRDKV